MADPQLMRLLNESANRNVQAIDRLREELIADRRRDDARIERLEGDVAELGGIMRSIRDEVASLTVTVAEVDERCGALVVTEQGPDGQQIVTARPAQLGLDAKTIIGAIVTLVTAGATPVIIAILSGGTP